MCSLLSLDDLNRFSRGSHCRCSVKTDILENFSNFQENICIGVSFNEVESQHLYQKRDSNADILLRNLRNFQEHQCSRVFLNDCFWFSESSISFSFVVWQISSASISTDYKVGIFLNFSNLLWSNAAISVLSKLKMFL